MAIDSKKVLYKQVKTKTHLKKLLTSNIKNNQAEHKSNKQEKSSSQKLGDTKNKNN